MNDMAGLLTEWVTVRGSATTAVAPTQREWLLTDWVTVRGSATTAVAPEREWLDLQGFSDATVWIDVNDVESEPVASPELTFRRPSNDQAVNAGHKRGPRCGSRPPQRGRSARFKR